MKATFGSKRTKPICFASKWVKREIYITPNDAYCPALTPYVNLWSAILKQAINENDAEYLFSDEFYPLSCTWIIEALNLNREKLLKLYIHVATNNLTVL